MTREEKLKFIKSHKEPPLDKEDIYYLKSPWKKFGCISSGICMCWCWYRDDVILPNITDEELDAAYNAIQSN